MLGLDAYGSDDDEPVVSAPPPPPVPRAQSRKRPVKFSVELPKVAEDSGSLNDDPPEPPAKRARTGAGKSSLLGLLPAPKNATPVPTASTPALGDGTGSSLRFRTKPQNEPKKETMKPPPPPPATHPPATSGGPDQSFFDLGPKTTRGSVNPTRVPPGPLPISSAPSVADFEPPEPTVDDPYPGYYLLPSGRWAQYDADYYESYWKNKQAEWEKSMLDSEDPHLSSETTQDISASDQLDHAKRLREERKSLTKNAMSVPEKPNMNIEAPKAGSRARYRHQITALLTEAYDKREELEEKIAQARRNRKESGSRYGF